MKYSLPAIILISFTFHCMAQGTYVPLGHDTYHFFDRIETKSGNIDWKSHTAVKPYNRFELQPLFRYAPNISLSKVDKSTFDYLLADNLISMEADDENDPGQSAGKPVFRHFYKSKSALYFLKTENVSFTLNPVLYFQGATDQNFDELEYINTRGLELQGIVNNKVGFYAFFTDNQMILPYYVRDYIRDNEAVPGEGFYKDFKDTKGVDFLSARGYITFRATKNIGLQFGHDKNFIGNGYRSLILSDHSNSYFFLKINTRFWKIQYQNLFTELTSQFVRGGEDTLRTKKYLVLHHLSYNVLKNLNIGLFEAIVFSRQDGFELQYLNPVIFYRSIEQNLGSPDNAFVGMDYKFNFLKHFSLYGQVVLDELNFAQFKKNSGWWGNKFAIQTGLKYIDVASVANLDIQIEYNIVRPFTYTYRDMHANLTHYNQPLAHPFGANFKEIVGILRYQPLPKLSLTAKVISAIHGADRSENWRVFASDSLNALTTNGGNIFVSYDKRKEISNNDFKHTIGQGIKETVLLLDLTISYQLRHNLYFDLRYIYRDFENELDKAIFPGAGIRTNYIGLAARLNIPQKNLDF